MSLSGTDDLEESRRGGNRSGIYVQRLRRIMIFTEIMVFGDKTLRSEPRAVTTKRVENRACSGPLVSTSYRSSPKTETSFSAGLLVSHFGWTFIKRAQKQRFATNQTTCSYRDTHLKHETY